MSKSKILREKRKKMLKDLVEFIHKIRALNNSFKIGKKFNFNVQAYLHITVFEDGKQVDITENVFRINLKSKELELPTIIIYEHDMRGNLIVRFAEGLEKLEYSDLRKIVEKLVREE